MTTDFQEEKKNLAELSKQLKNVINTLWETQVNCDRSQPELFSANIKELMENKQTVSELSHSVDHLIVPAQILQLVDFGDSPNELLTEWYRHAKWRNDICRGRHAQADIFRSRFNARYEEFINSREETEI